MRVSHRVADKIARFGGLVAGACTVLMVLHILLNAALRYIDGPLPGTTEVVSNWWMPIVAFAGLAYAATRDEHITVRLFEGVTRSGRRTPAWVSTLVTLVSLGAIALLGWYGLQNALESLSVREQMIGSITLTTWPIAFVVPIGAAALFVCVLFRELRRSDTTSTETGALR